MPGSPPATASAAPLVGLGHAAEAALARGELRQRAVDLLAAEVRPVGGCGVELGVGGLPEQEVGEAHLAARADHEVRVGRAGGVKVGAEAFLVDLLRRDAIRDDLLQR